MNVSVEARRKPHRSTCTQNGREREVWEDISLIWSCVCEVTYLQAGVRRNSVYKDKRTGAQHNTPQGVNQALGARNPKIYTHTHKHVYIPIRRARTKKQAKNLIYLGFWTHPTTYIDKKLCVRRKKSHVRLQLVFTQDQLTLSSFQRPNHTQTPRAQHPYIDPAFTYVHAYNKKIWTSSLHSERDTEKTGRETHRDK